MPLLARITRRPAGLVLNSSNQRRHRPDYILLLLSLMLVGFGMIVVYSISPGLAASTGQTEQYYVSKQALAIGLGIIAFLVCGNLPTTFLRRNRLNILVLAALSALAVQIFGQEVNGAYRWIQIGGFSFQSVELIKFAVIFFVADLLAEKMRSGEINSWKATLRPLLLITLACGVVVAGLQSDLGSAGVVMAIIAILSFEAGIQLKRIILFIGLLLIGIILAISGSSYRRDRLNSYLNPERSCQSSGYQACQALIAVGSGGVFGLGLGKSVQAYGYQPEAANDSIFAILAEQFGFLGVGALLILYFALFARLKNLIERTNDNFGRLVVSGILVWLSTQVIINIGSMIGLLPLKGITLPLISYGGTSLIFVMAALGVAFYFSRFSTYLPLERNKKERAGYEGNTQRRGDRRPYYATLSRRP